VADSSIVFEVWGKARNKGGIKGSSTSGNFSRLVLRLVQRGACETGLIQGRLNRKMVALANHRKCLDADGTRLVGDVEFTVADHFFPFLAQSPHYTEDITN
jgi:hypothetical protein